MSLRRQIYFNNSSLGGGGQPNTEPASSPTCRHTVCVKALKTEKIVNLAWLRRSVRATIYGTFNADQFVRCLISATIAHATGNTSFWYISAQRFCFGAGFDRGVVLVHGRGVVLVHENGTLRWSASRQNQPPFFA